MDVRLEVPGDRPSTHPALFLLEQLLGRVAVPPVARGRITLHINGGRVNDIHADYLIPPGGKFALTWTPLTPAQHAAAQAVADVLPELERIRADCHLVLRVRRGQPILPLIFRGRYPVPPAPGSVSRPGRSSGR